MTTQTMAQLRQLKLGGMAHALQTQLEQVGTYEGLPFVERLTLLVEHECMNREQRKQERLIRQARFRLSASIQEIDYQHPRNITPSQIAQLAAYSSDFCHPFHVKTATWTRAKLPPFGAPATRV